jgi:hypothetical protein
MKKARRRKERKKTAATIFAASDKNDAGRYLCDREK